MAAVAGGTRAAMAGRASFAAMASSIPPGGLFSPSPPCVAAVPRARLLSRPAAPSRARWGLPKRDFPGSEIRSRAASSSLPSAADAAGGAAAAVDATAELVDALDIRVGRILKAWRHPEADSLYVEEVDLAEPDGPRTICSGLVNYASLEELQL